MNYSTISNHFLKSTNILSADIGINQSVLVSEVR